MQPGSQEKDLNDLPIVTWPGVEILHLSFMHELDMEELEL